MRIDRFLHIFLTKGDTMIIDTHAHIGSVLTFRMTMEDVLYSMERYGVDFSLISNIEAVECDNSGRLIPKLFQTKQNSLIKKMIRVVRPHSDKLGILVWIKPLTEQPDDEFVRLIEENRDIIYGFKTHPFHSRVAPDDERMEAYYKIAERFGFPIASHTGGCPEAASIHMFNAAKAHPKLDFIMVHMDLGTDNSQAVDLLGRLPNLYGDTTWVSVESTLKAVKLWGSEKILFGTDNPIDGKDTLLHNKTGDRSLYQYYFNEFRSQVSAEDYDNIMYKNARRIFRIDK